MDTYEKKYNEALKDMKAIYPNLKGDAKLAVEHAFPELAESEDERICRSCIALLRKVSAYSGEEYLGVEIVDCIIGLQALIKKQKESLHISETCKENAEYFTDEDERIRKALIAFFNDYNSGIAINGISAKEFIAYLEKQKVIAAIPDELVECYKNLCERGNRGVASLINAINGINEQKEQKPVEWSDEDEEMLDQCIDAIEYQLFDNGEDDKINTDARINWLKSLRPSWKPSEEQMEALYEAAQDAAIDRESGNALYELYEQLKRLM